MRYVPVEYLQAGMILGQDMHDASGRLLLGKHIVLSGENISYITFLGVPGVYIDDAFTKDIEIQEVVRPEVRDAALTLIKDYFSAEMGAELPPEEKSIFDSVNEVVEDILDDDTVMKNLVHVKIYDDYTYFHSVNVGIIAGVIGAKCHLPKHSLTELVTAGFLHDIGKSAIDKELLNAPRQLTEVERMRMMDHPRIGYETLVSKYEFSENICLAVYQHHEWYNGSGYPCHIDAKKTLKISRILKCADVYDAMTSKRPYHDPYLPSEVLEYFMGRSGMEFDPEIVQIMATEFSVYPVGCEVQLSDGRRGIVVRNHRGYVLRPALKMLEDGKIIDLCNDPNTRNLTIVKLFM